MEDEAPSHLNNKNGQEAAAAAADPSSSQMSMDEQRHLSSDDEEDQQPMEEERDQSQQERAAGSPPRPKTEEEQAEERWEAYLRSQHSRETFAHYYRCRPMSLLATDAAADYDDGNRVVMPQSALERLSAVQIEYPMVFQIQNAATSQASHVGVQEFVADEGFVHVPTHTMARLGLLSEDGDGPLVLLTSTSLPKATFVKLRPHTSDFLRVRYPKELLEYNFGKYTCMTVGDTIAVVEGERRFLLDVVEAKPAHAVSTIETDCEVDFLPPLDYEEPAARVSAPLSRVPVKVAIGQGVGEKRFSDIVGVRMDGKPVERTAPAKMADNGQGKGRFSHAGVRMDGMPVERRAPARIANNGQGKGRFSHAGVRMDGMPVEPAPMVPATSPFASASKTGKKANPFTGNKYSLQD